jgi:transporter family protein
LLATEGILASLIGHFAYYWAQKTGDLSRVVPVAAAAPLITVLLAWMVLSETPHWRHGVGAALIFAGAALIKG